MVERGDWITPRFLGQPFLDKPIFYFWVQAASLWLFGTNEAAVRLPGLMFGLLGAMTTGLLGWRMFGRTTGWIAGILYATTILPTAMAQAASHDVALIPWVNLTLLLLWESDRAIVRRVRAECVLGAGAFLGLAILTKGLFGVAVVGLAYGGYLVTTRRFSLALLLRGAGVLAVAVAVAAPWYALVAVRNPGYLRYFFLDRHVLGFATASQPHGDAAVVVLSAGAAGRRIALDRLSADRGARCPDPAALGHPGARSSVARLAALELVDRLDAVDDVGRLEAGDLSLAGVSADGRVGGHGLDGLIDGTLGDAARRSFARTFALLVMEWADGVAGGGAGGADRVRRAIRLAGLAGRGYGGSGITIAPDPVARRPVAGKPGGGGAFDGRAIRGRDGDGGAAGGRDVVGP